MFTFSARLHQISLEMVHSKNSDVYLFYLDLFTDTFLKLALEKYIFNRSDGNDASFRIDVKMYCL